jgi:hypothetical protein
MLDLVFVPNLFGQSEIAQEIEHPDVFWKNQGIEGSNASLARGVDQTLRECEAQAVPLPPIGDDRGVFGAISPRFAVVPDDRDNLCASARVKGNECKPITPIKMREVKGLLFTQV